ncbi:DUF7344 domain-containing protein [Halorarius litoreus]|uniref:DUF7344 domain-containing protein n=1 Tax=Halorarius litoreus TaxID=2962676 RepID=UPI0020CE8C57|nr:hypothetical protein [Halorarius litoreus]
MSNLLDTLSHHLRREIIYFFENNTTSNTATLDELISQVEHRVPDEHEHELTVKLVHNHLPKLARAEWLDHDKRTGEIRYHGHEHAERWLRQLSALFSNDSSHCGDID